MPKIMVSLAQRVRRVSLSFDPEALDGQNSSTLGILGTSNFPAPLELFSLSSKMNR
jgi:hypothetical protein